jgi:hypothetical protein
MGGIHGEFYRNREGMCGCARGIDMKTPDASSYGYKSPMSQKLLEKAPTFYAPLFHQY